MKNACGRCGSKIFYVCEPFLPKTLCKACESRGHTVLVQPLRGDKAKAQKARCLRALQSAIDRNLDPSDPKIERIIQCLKRTTSPQWDPDFDPVTMQNLLASGKIGTVWGANIVVTGR